MQTMVHQDRPQEVARQPARLEAIGLQALIDTLRAQGFTVIAPTLQNGVICLDEISSITQLPAGAGDEQEPGRYRVRPLDDGAFFSHTVGPHSWKRYLQPTERRLWQARRTDGRFELVLEDQPAPRFAFLGVRPCDLHAIDLLDRIYLQGHYPDSFYEARRAGLLLIAVNCLNPGGTCFCASMGTGPRATGGFDLALTEIVDGSSHFFVAESGSDRGNDLLAVLPHRPAAPEELACVESRLADAASRMGRSLDTQGLPDLLLHNLEHPHWEEIAQRCLTCGNCTMVCPTCFCATVKDVTTLGGERAERWRRADSCFSIEFSHIYGGSIRQSAQSRYRQWMVHKLATWVGQFGTMGCVGCGRCITWCPVGIDLTAEARVFRETGKRKGAKAARSGSKAAITEVA